MVKILNYKKPNLGFTLIELLVVVAIIGLLSSMVLTSLNEAKAKARDAQRIQDIKQIETALELFYADYERYPSTCSSGTFPLTCDDLDMIGEVIGSGGTFDLLLEGNNPKGIVYMKNVPSDPLWDSAWGNVASDYGIGNTYYYYAYDPTHKGGGSCDPTINIHYFETSGNKTFWQALRQSITGSNMDVPNSDYTSCPNPSTQLGF